MSVYFKLSAFLLIATLFFSCSERFFFQEFQSIKQWNSEEKIAFKVSIKDPTEPYQLFIDLRHKNTYPYQNLWVFMTTKSPKNNYFKDTIELQLADFSGKWKGNSSSGNLINHHILFSKDMRFNEAGSYTFSFEQAMRQEKIDINELGLIIQKGPLR